MTVLEGVGFGPPSRRSTGDVRAPGPVKRAAVILAVGLSASCAAERGEEPDAGGVDAAIDGGEVTPSDAGSIDAGSIDAGSIDAGSIDVGSLDVGSAHRIVASRLDLRRPTPGPAALRPGRGVDVASGAVRLGASFADVVFALGAPLGPVEGSDGRAFAFAIPDGDPLTVWFGDRDLDGTLDAHGDRVIWIGVGPRFTGRTPEGLGLGAPADALADAYGPPDLVTEADGSSAWAYFTSGAWFEVSGERLRSVVVHRAYRASPGGAIDVGAGAFFLGDGAVQGGLTTGTADAEIERLLGEPDGEAVVKNELTSITVKSWALLGIELFSGPNGRVAFAMLHAPYYGTTDDGLGIGSPRAAVEASLAAQGFGPAIEVALDGARLWCHRRGSNRAVGLFYDDDGRVNTIVLALPASICAPG